MGRALYPWRFIGPVLALEAVLVAIPLATGVWYSLHRADYFQITAWRGLDNYWTVLQSATVQRSLVATAVFTLFSLVFTFGAGLAMALFLERDSRLAVLVRAVVLVPYVISMLVGSLLLKWLFSSDGGILPLVLSPLGLGQATILGDPDAAMAALVFNAVWRDSAFAMILLLAGLKGIDPQLHAAARIDGAGAWMRFRRLTLPLLRVPILITLVRLAIHFVNVLTYALVLTSGGPNGATQTLGLTTYTMGFVDYRIGQANALAFVVFLFNLVLIVGLLRLFRERRVAA